MKFSKIKLQMIREKDFDYNSRHISSSKEIVEYINSIVELEKETEEIILLICLNAKNQIISFSEIARGQINCCGLDMKSIFKTVLMCNSNRFILVHNHPSGSAEASKYDIQITELIKKASKIMNIEFLDHLIIGVNEYTSCLK